MKENNFFIKSLLLIFLFIIKINEAIQIIDRASGNNGYANNYGYNARQQRPHAQRQTGGNNNYRVSLPKPKKPSNRVPVFLQDVDFNAGATGTDAIRIVEPPVYFQEQKNRFQKPSPNKQHHQQLYDPYGYFTGKPVHPKQSNRPYNLPLRQHIDSSFTGPEYEPSELSYHSPQSGPKSLPYLQHSQHSQALEQITRPQKYATIHHSVPHSQALEQTPRPQKYPTAHHSLSLNNHPKPTPTYSGIQTPIADSLRLQLQRFKEQQKYLFEDQNDEHPARQKPTKSKPKKKVIDSKYTTNYDTYEDKKLAKKPKFQINYNVDNSGINFGENYYEQAPAKPSNAKQINQNQQSFISENSYHKPRPTKSSYDTRYNTEQLDQHKIYNKPSKQYPQTYAVVEHTTPEIQSESSTFTPYKLLSSVRHRQRTGHRPKDDDNAKERLRTQKVHTVYSEQGFEDTEYDHDKEEREGKRKKKIRHKRDIIAENILKYNNETTKKNYNEMIDQMEELPIALSMTDSRGKQLTGRALIEHINELLKNTSKFFPEEMPDTDNVSIILNPEELEELLKQPMNLTLTHPELFEKTMMVERNDEFMSSSYIEDNIKASPYRRYNNVMCENQPPDFQQNNEKKKLGNLGPQLDCLKEQLFGENPFSNRFFTQTGKFILSSDNKTPVPTTFPSSTVYADVMQVIKSALHNEIRLANLQRAKQRKLALALNRPKLEYYDIADVNRLPRTDTDTFKNPILNLRNAIKSEITSSSKLLVPSKNNVGTVNLLPPPKTINGLNSKNVIPLKTVASFKHTNEAKPSHIKTDNLDGKTPEKITTNNKKKRVIEISSHRNIGRNFKNIESFPIEFDQSQKKNRRKKKIRPQDSSVAQTTLLNTPNTLALPESDKSDIFDVTKYIPKAYMITQNGNIFRIKYRPQTKLTAVMHKPKENPQKLRKKRRRVQVELNNKRKKVKNNNRRVLSIKNPINTPPETEKFSHENGINRYLAKQKYQT